MEKDGSNKIPHWSGLLSAHVLLTAESSRHDYLNANFHWEQLKGNHCKASKVSGLPSKQYNLTWLDEIWYTLSTRHWIDAVEIELDVSTTNRQIKSRNGNQADGIK